MWCAGLLKRCCEWSLSVVMVVICFTKEVWILLVWMTVNLTGGGIPGQHGWYNCLSCVGPRVCSVGLHIWPISDGAHTHTHASRLPSWSAALFVSECVFVSVVFVCSSAPSAHVLAAACFFYSTELYSKMFDLLYIFSLLFCLCQGVWCGLQPYFKAALCLCHLRWADIQTGYICSLC